MTCSRSHKMSVRSHLRYNLTLLEFELEGQTLVFTLSAPGMASGLTGMDAIIRARALNRY